MKIKHVCGLLALLLLSATLVPYPVQAETALEWIEVDKPGLVGNIVVTPSEVSEIAVGRNGVLYAIDSENSKAYRSLNAGVSWEDMTSYMLDADAQLPASKVAVAPDKPGIVAVVSNDSTEVYLSTDGGMTWVDSRVPDVAGTIQAVAISNQYTEAGESLREIAIGTAVWGNNVTSGQVWVLRLGETWASWQDQSLVIDPSHVGGEVSALAYSPDYQRDRILVVVASTAADVAVDFQNRTWLCLGERDTEDGTTSWDSFDDYPAEIAAAGDAEGVAWVNSSLALPSDYSSEDESLRRLFVSYNREPDAEDDVYRLDDTTVHRMNADGGADINIASISYHGTTDSGTLLAGDVDPVAGTFTVQVRRTSFTDGFHSSPTWYPSTVPPTGPGNAKVAWSPDGKIAYCGTGQSPGASLDESALSASLDGDKWRQLGLMDTTIKLADIAPAPDSKSLFLTTYNPFGPEGVWRSAGDPLGRYWERLLAMDTATDAVILRLSPNYSDDSTMYAAEAGGKLMAVSYNRGNTWQWRRAPGPVIDMAVEDEDTLYVALPGGKITKSTDGGRRWEAAAEIGLPDINMLAIADKETILIGSRNGEVAYSTDGGTSFTQISEVPGDGDVQVVADANYPENGSIYAATNLPDAGIWRWSIGTSTEWEQIDKFVTELGKGQCIGGLAVGSEGTLYALRSEPASDTTGGMTRWLCPTCPTCMDFEYDFINFSLPQCATFDPTAVFPNTLPYLKLSGDAEQNELWAVDTANQTIYRFEDTLCKFGPSLDAPADRAVISTGPCPCDYVTSLFLHWTELSGTTTYEGAIYLDSEGTLSVWSGGSDSTSIMAVGGASSAHLDTGATYYWRVRSIEPIKSPWSEIWSFAPSLGAVSVGVPSPGAIDVPIKPVFTWNSVAGAIGYEFVLARDSEFTEVVVAMVGADALPATAWGCDRDLDYETTYFWKVRAISVDSYGEWVSSVFTTEAALSPSASHFSSPLPEQTQLPQPTPSVPFYLLIIIGLGTTLVIVLLVLIVKTRR